MGGMAQLARMNFKKAMEHLRAGTPEAESIQGLRAWLMSHGLEEYHQKALEIALEHGPESLSDLLLLEPEDFEIKMQEGMAQLARMNFKKAMEHLRAGTPEAECKGKC